MVVEINISKVLLMIHLRKAVLILENYVVKNIVGMSKIKNHCKAAVNMVEVN